MELEVVEDNQKEEKAKEIAVGKPARDSGAQKRSLKHSSSKLPDSKRKRKAGSPSLSSRKSSSSASASTSGATGQARTKGPRASSPRASSPLAPAGLARSPVVHTSSSDALSALRSVSPPVYSNKRKEDSSDASRSATRKVRAVASSQGRPVPGSPPHASGESAAKKSSSSANVSAASPPEQPVVLNRMVFEQEFIDYMATVGHSIAVKDVIKKYKHAFKHPASKQIVIDTIKKCANTDNSIVSLKEEYKSRVR